MWSIERGRTVTEIRDVKALCGRDINYSKVGLVNIPDRDSGSRTQTITADNIYIYIYIYIYDKTRTSVAFVV